MTLETLNKQKNRRVLKITAIAATAWIMLSLSCFTAFADEQTTILTTLQNLEIAGKTDLFMGVFRSLGFVILKFLGSIADTCYGGLESIYNALDFTHSSELLALNKRYSMMYKVIFVIALAVLGLYLIGRQANNQLNTMSCLMIMVVIIMAMPIFTEKLSDLTKASASYAQAQWSSSAAGMKLDTISGSIVDDYIIDLKKVDKNINEGNIGTLKNAVNKYTGYNNLDERTDEWRDIDITAVMDYEEGDLSKGYWDKYMEKDDDGKWAEEKLSTWLPFMDNYYYRWQFSSWAYPIIMLLILSVVLVFTGFRCGVFIINIAMAEIYLPFISVTDLTSGQRTKEAIKHFFILFGSIFLCIALLGLYFIGYQWINAHLSSILPRLILQVALAYEIINGPNLIERILGVDVGVKQGWQVALGAKMAADTVGGAAKGAGHMAKGAGRAGAAAGVAAASGGKKAYNAMSAMKERFSGASESGNAGNKTEAENEKSRFAAANDSTMGNRSGTDPMNARAEAADEASGINREESSDSMSQKQKDAAGNTSEPGTANGSRIDPMASRKESPSAQTSGSTSGMGTQADIRMNPDSMSQRGPSSTAPGGGIPQGGSTPQREQATRYNPQPQSETPSRSSRVNVKDTMDKMDRMDRRKE